MAMLILKDSRGPYSPPCKMEWLAGVAELADARDSKSRDLHWSCGFDPHLQHQYTRMPRPIAATITPVIDTPPVTTPQEERYSGITGPRIRCPLCEWMPAPGDQWACSCGHSWNTFETGGVCPGCLTQWPSTQCHECHGWSAHSAWYQY